MATNLEVAQLLDIPEAEYHADYSRVSHSMLEVFIESPRLYRGRFITGEYPPPESKTFDFGKAAHALALESRRVFVPIPRDVLNEQGHKKGAAWKEWEAANAGQIHLKDKDVADLQFIIAEIMRNPLARSLVVSEAKREHVIHWIDGETGLPLKCRIDVLRDSCAWIADMKTTGTTDEDALQKQFYEFGYHRQASMYINAVEALCGITPKFYFVFCLKEPPYTVDVFEPSDELLTMGDIENRAALDRLQACMDADQWDSPTYGMVRTMYARPYDSRKVFTA